MHASSRIWWLFDVATSLLHKGLIFPLRRARHWNHFRAFGKGSVIVGRIICYRRNIWIGAKTVLNEGVILNGSDELRIGAHCHISAYAQLHTGGMDLQDPDYVRRVHTTAPIIIEDGVWVGAGAIVVAGVTIGEGSVVGAGSVVVKDVPPFELWAGTPARHIKKLPRPT